MSLYYCTKLRGPYSQEGLGWTLPEAQVESLHDDSMLASSPSAGRWIHSSLRPESGLLPKPEIEQDMKREQAKLNEELPELTGSLLNRTAPGRRS
jgi:hypothetical protein